MKAAEIVDKLLEQGEDFDPREYLQKSSAEGDFDEGVKELLAYARKLYAELEQMGVLHTAAGDWTLSPQILPKAVLMLALERDNTGEELKFLRRIKRYARYRI